MFLHPKAKFYFIKDRVQQLINRINFTNPHYCSDDYEMIHYIGKVLHRGDTVFDIGANNGSISIFIAKLIGPTGIVYSFEPEKKNYENLLQNIRRYRINNIVSYDIAIGHNNYPFILNIFPHSGWHSKYIPIIEGKKLVPLSKQMTKAYSLDYFCEKNKISTIDLAKIDTEGCEYDILRGCKKLLKNKKIKIIIFEISKGPMLGSKMKPEKIFTLLNNSGYQIFSFYAPASVDKPMLVTSASGIDVDLGNFIAVPK